MSDIEITYINESINELKKKMDIMTQQMNEISLTLNKNPFLECKDNFDKRYLQIELFEIKWREAYEKHQSNNLNQANTKINLYKNTMSIIQALAPYLILVYAIINK